MVVVSHRLSRKTGYKKNSWSFFEGFYWLTTKYKFQKWGSIRRGHIDGNATSIHHSMAYWTPMTAPDWGLRVTREISIALSVIGRLDVRPRHIALRSGWAWLKIKRYSWKHLLCKSCRCKRVHEAELLLLCFNYLLSHSRNELFLPVVDFRTTCTNPLWDGLATGFLLSRCSPRATGNTFMTRCSQIFVKQDIWTRKRMSQSPGKKIDAESILFRLLWVWRFLSLTSSR